MAELTKGVACFYDVAIDHDYVWYQNRYAEMLLAIIKQKME